MQAFCCSSNSSSLRYPSRRSMLAAWISGTCASRPCWITVNVGQSGRSAQAQRTGQCPSSCSCRRGGKNAAHAVPRGDSDRRYRSLRITPCKPGAGKSPRCGGSLGPDVIDVRGRNRIRHDGQTIQRLGTTTLPQSLRRELRPDVFQHDVQIDGGPRRAPGRDAVAEIVDMKRERRALAALASITCTGYIVAFPGADSRSSNRMLRVSPDIRPYR